MSPEPSERPAEPVFVEETIALARIEAIVSNARATWLVLIGFLAFITVTLLSVRDLDFFSATAVTSLPIVDVAIPTTVFFWTAAWLAAVLHTYFHLFLLRLWDALAEAPPRIGKPDEGRLRLGERVFPWLVNDWALRGRPDRAVTERQMDWLADVVTALVVWLATPLVLAGFWWRSMPAHDAWLTLKIALALLLSLYASLQGWRRARARLRAPGVRPSAGSVARHLPGVWRSVFAALAVAVIGTGFLRTEVGEIEIGPFQSRALWLAPIDLAGAEIAEKPDDWVGRDTAERRFRVTWCRDRGLPPDACAPPTAPYQEAARTAWCGGVRAIEDCDDRFREMDEAFDDEWRETRGEFLANLTRPDLSGRDLRGANLSGAFLAGVALVEAGLEGADLTGARLQSAEWAGATIGASPAHSADFTGGEDLTQTQLDQVIGNEETILPLDAESGEQLHVWSCWAEPPATMDGLLRLWPEFMHDELRAQWLCPEGVAPERTGRPEEPPPDG